MNPRDLPRTNLIRAQYPPDPPDDGIGGLFRGGLPDELSPRKKRLSRAAVAALLALALLVVAGVIALAVWYASLISP